MRSWLPEDHQVWLLIDVVSNHLDTSAFHARARTGGAGAPGYDPDMLVTLLIWCYAQGERSSRRIERLCHQVPVAPEEQMTEAVRHGRLGLEQRARVG